MHSGIHSLSLLLLKKPLSTSNAMQFLFMFNNIGLFHFRLWQTQSNSSTQWFSSYGFHYSRNLSLYSVLVSHYLQQCWSNPLPLTTNSKQFVHSGISLVLLPLLKKPLSIATQSHFISDYADQFRLSLWQNESAHIHNIFTCRTTCIKSYYNTYYNNIVLLLVERVSIYSLELITTALFLSQNQINDVLC